MRISPAGGGFLEAHLDLLENPYELCLHASEVTRRQLNQAIFAHIYIVHDDVAGDEINLTPGNYSPPNAAGAASTAAWTAKRPDCRPGRECPPQWARNA